MESLLIPASQDQGTVRRKVVLEFPRSLLNKPVIWNLSHRYDLVFNILKANVDDGRGHMVLELAGDSSQCDSGVEYLRQLGVDVQGLTETIRLDKERCTECGACLAMCPTDAFTQDPGSMEIGLNVEACIACGICARSCPTRALSLQAIVDGNGP